ncbi:unnamed protein product [Leptidea sinapis]|uniref:SURP motif domain-containing protein n=1 Tax=Leptidea sinapis TaxID=189913 RepID=A0A5E4QLK3_9NEOP|nr:unnamed protein product [Leptidea sinapis]
MSVKWTSSETGILRKCQFKEKKEELLVFGYSCKLFRDDDRALQVDQGKHLIPWMGDETLKIDRYDARGALHDLSALEAPPGGFDWRLELKKSEYEVEQLCDEERYRALHTDEDEEEMYKEEELKRLHAAGYGQVGFNYETSEQNVVETPAAEVEEPFLPSEEFKALLPNDMVYPESIKQNAIIEKTAMFIASQGAQMEILIKAKQGENPQFKFLNKESPLNIYYMALIALVKSGKWPEKKQEIVDDKPNEHDEYLHPSLAATIIESAPSIPSIHYKPSADCDYTLLISKMRGEAATDEAYSAELAPGEVAPPGTEPLPPRNPAEITRAPVMYNQTEQAVNMMEYNQYAAYYKQYMSQTTEQAQQVVEPSNKPPSMAPSKSTGLSLMKNYNTDSDSDLSDFDDTSSEENKRKPVITIPPDDVKLVIDKMAAYVARNGDEFADIVRAKNDPRFTFLDPGNVYHPFYKKLMQEKRGVNVNGMDKSVSNTTPVSFSIKKLKEPDPILPKPALPYESSSDDDEKKDATETESQEDKTNIPNVSHMNTEISHIPPVVVYKMESALENQKNDLPTVRATEQKVKTEPKVVMQETTEVKERIKVEMKPAAFAQIVEIKTDIPELQETKDSLSEVKNDHCDKIKREDFKMDYRDTKKEKNYESEKRKEKDKELKRERERDIDRDVKRERSKREKDGERSKREKHKSESKRSKRERDREKEGTRDSERHKKKKKHNKEELMETEIISLEDNSDEMIDLTGDVSDAKGESETEVDASKQHDRRRRAAEFLKKVGVDPGAALCNTSLASAMVDTLESIRKKKAEEEEKRRRRDKRRRRREYDEESERRRKRRRKERSSDEDTSDYESSKRRRHKKEKKQSKDKKRRRGSMCSEEDQPMSIDLTNTLKELRNVSPTRALELDAGRAVSDDDGEVKREKKKEREYSEGEWSSDSDEDSLTSLSQ